MYTLDFHEMFLKLTWPFFICLCIGHDSREDYHKLGTLSVVFPKANVVAMTATITKEYQTAFTKSLNVKKDPKLVIANPSRSNIFMRYWKGLHVPVLGKSSHF